jgi:aryl-phospho-beta-D-glucosidase BglC (GH1 family)
VSYLGKSAKKTVTKTLTCKVTVKDAVVTTEAPAPAATTETTAAPTEAPTEAPTPVPTVDISILATVTMQPVGTAGAVITAATANPDDADREQLTVKWDDTTNIGEERTVTIKGGTSDSMVVKDNGVMRKELSSQYLIQNEMGTGINLGNTMEATQSVATKDDYTEATDFETAWGSTVITQEVIDGIHSYGFNTIRIPVAWSNMVKNDDTTFTINEKYLGRVEEIVNYALNDGMYVIINDHWDSGWWGEFGATYRDENGNKQANEAMRQQAWVRYIAYWTQICERFKDYSDHLIFEGANEELGDRLNDGVYEEGYSGGGSGNAVKGNLSKNECYQITNTINQLFVNIVRNSGGNNAYRHLLIPGYDTDIDKTVDGRYTMPTDTEENGVSKLSVSVHYYTPWDFCGDNSTGDYDESDKVTTQQQLSLMRYYSEQGYGVILGEYGVCNPRQDKVCDWLYDVMCYSSDYGILPVLWDSDGRYYNRTKCAMKYADVGELYNSVTGADGDTTMDSNTGVPAPAETVDASDLTSVWDWTGKWYKNGGANTVGDDRSETVSKGDVAKFVPVSNISAANDGDTTTIDFNSWGYQAFIKLDLSQYEKPAIAFDFATDDEDSVGDLTLYSTSKIDGSASVEDVVTYSDFTGKAVILSDALVDDLYFGSYLAITFGNSPTVTGIHIYDAAE